MCLMVKLVVSATIALLISIQRPARGVGCGVMGRRGVGSARREALMASR